MDLLHALVLVLICSTSCYGWKDIRIKRKKSLIHTPSPALGPMADEMQAQCLDSTLNFDQTTYQMHVCLYDKVQIKESSLDNSESKSFDAAADSTLTGVFRGWEILDNTYKTMVFEDGDICKTAALEDDGQQRRWSTRVIFKVLTDAEISDDDDDDDDAGLGTLKLVDDCHVQVTLLVPLPVELLEASLGLESPGVLRSVPDHVELVPDSLPKESDNCEFFKELDVIQEKIMDLKMILNDLLIKREESAAASTTVEESSRVYKASLSVLDASTAILQSASEI